MPKAVIQFLQYYKRLAAAKAKIIGLLWLKYDSCVSFDFYLSYSNKLDFNCYVNAFKGLINLKII